MPDCALTWPTQVLGEDLSAIVSYDDRLLKAAADAGLGTESPRD